MRRLVAAVALMLVAVACTSVNYTTSTGILVHWRQTGVSQDRTVRVLVPAVLASDGQFMRSMNHAVEAWNVSPYLNLVLDSPNTVPADCPGPTCSCWTPAAAGWPAHTA